jgi:molybdopterin molybdotransferase
MTADPAPRRAPVEDVLALLRARAAPLPAERVPLAAAAGRVLAEPVVSAVAVPGFPKSAMDGFAARSPDLAAGAVLAVVGDSRPGRPFGGSVGHGQAVRITTGAPVPAGADAVLPVEQAGLRADGSVVVVEPVPAGRHVLRVGEDVAAGREVLPAGRRLRPQDVGLLAAVGAGEVAVVRRPRVAALVTGGELLPPGAVPDGYRVVDSNSPMLAALAARDGADWLGVAHRPDDVAAIRDPVAATAADVLLISGGTSAGPEDHAPAAVAAAGELAVRGVALRPAAPTGVGFLPGGRVVFLLPGNPAACLCAYDLFAGRVVRRLGGRGWELPYRAVTVPLAAPLRSAAGRVDYVRVVIAAGLADPVPGGASRLSTVVHADGFVLVPADVEELPAGHEVEVFLY